jgi:hypothetical protein
MTGMAEGEEEVEFGGLVLELEEADGTADAALALSVGVEPSANVGTGALGGELASRATDKAVAAAPEAADALRAVTAAAAANGNEEGALKSENGLSARKAKRRLKAVQITGQNEIELT